MRRIANTWELMKSSWRILMHDKPMLILLLIPSIAAVLLMTPFFFPWLATVAGWQGIGTDHALAPYAIVFSYYLCYFFVMYFFNAALVDYVVTRLRGDEPSVGASLREAARCAPQIAMWAIVAATVGIVLQTIQSRAGFLGKLVAGFLGIGWTLVTFFVVPMIVIERKGAIESISDSAAMVKETWGEQAVSGVGFGLMGFLMSIPVLLIVMLPIIFLSVNGGPENLMFILLVGAPMLWVITVGVVLAALKAIFSVVLYLYTKTGKVPEGFTASNLRNAIATA